MAIHYVTFNPYAIGMVTGHGLSFCREIHAAPCHNVMRTPEYSSDQLHTLYSQHADHQHIDNMLAQVGDKSLIVEVHHFRAIKRHFKQLQEQMEKLKDKM